MELLRIMDPKKTTLELDCGWAVVAGKKVKITTLDVTPAMAKKWIEAAREGKFDANAV